MNKDATAAATLIGQSVRQQAWEVIGHGLPRHIYPNATRTRRRRVIDTVFCGPNMTAEEVRDGLVNHDGYDADITVRKAR